MKEIALKTAFVERVKKDPFLGEELLTSLDTASPTTVRLNPFKKTEVYANEEKIPWCKNAIKLVERPQFTLDPLFHAGCYYPQESGSMILDTVLRSLPLPAYPICLDLCAAPGGKSTLLLSFLEGRGLLVSNEVIHSRAQILKENVTKWGPNNTVVTNADPSEFDRLDGFFDCMVVDAPCSGEGMFRKLPDSRTEWSEDNVHLCAARQTRILHDVWPSLKAGGYLIYSTCTLNEMENETNVQNFCQETGAEIITVPDLPAKSDRKGLGYYCLPNHMNTEGFYFAVLKKPDGIVSNIKWKTKKDFKPIKKTEEIEEVIDMDGQSFYDWNGKLFVLPTEFEKEMLHVQAHLRTLKIGLELGEQMKKGLQFSHEWPLSCLNKKTFPSIELNLEQARSYLRLAPFALEAERGIYQVCYNQIPLGFIKHLGNRFNSGYPKEWRIRNL